MRFKQLDQQINYIDLKIEKRLSWRNKELGSLFHCSYEMPDELCLNASGEGQKTENVKKYITIRTIEREAFEDSVDVDNLQEFLDTLIKIQNFKLPFLT